MFDAYGLCQLRLREVPFRPELAYPFADAHARFLVK